MRKKNSALIKSYRSKNFDFFRTKPLRLLTFVACLLGPPLSIILYKNPDQLPGFTLAAFFYAPKTRFSYMVLVYCILFIVLSFVLLIRFCVAPHALEYFFIALFVVVAAIESAG